MNAKIEELKNKAVNYVNIMKEKISGVERKKMIEEIRIEQSFENEMKEAIENLKIAEEHFSHATGDYIDIANKQLSIAHEKIATVLLKTKKFNEGKQLQ